MIEMLIAGGWMMVPIVLCSLVALTIVLERGRYFGKLTNSRNSDHMIQFLEKGKFTDALSISERQPNPLLRVLAVGIMSRNQDPEKAMEAAAVAELTRMKRGLSALDTIITLAPLLGLLGTIIGMIDSFGIMADQGLGQPHAVTGGVAEALICTAAGIFVAVMTLIPYNYFLARIEQTTESIEYYATRVETILKETKEKKPRATATRRKKESAN